MAKRQKDGLFSRTDAPESGDLALVVAIKGGVTVGSISVTAGPGQAATSVVTRVAASATNVTLLALNTARRGACLTNSSATQPLYLKLGATASISGGAESYTAVLAPNTGSGGGYYEVPFGYTGIIDGIWGGADASGECLVTELTA
jgi:hypothetical protein